MKKAVALFGERALGAFKYFLAAIMVVEGIATMFSPLEPLGGSFGLLYSSRIALICFGLVFVASGLTLLYGKIRKKRKWVGNGLLSIAGCFLFGALLNGFTLGWPVGAWLWNAILALIVSALYLRWRFKTEYVDPNHFVDDVDGMRHDGPPSLRY